MTVSPPPGTAANGSQASPAPQNGRSRARLISGICLFFFLAGALWLAYWFFILRLEESTDDAYVAGNQIRIASQVTGNIQEIFVDNTQWVHAGQVLARLDDTDALLALEQARDALASAVRETRSLMAEYERLRSLVALREQELGKALGNFERRRDRRTAMAVSEEELSHAKDDLAIAETALRVAKDDMARTRLLLQDTPLRMQPAVRQKAHQVREAWLALQRCAVKSPADGYVARRTAQVGMHVTPGQPLMAVVPLSQVWVDANFKEVQLARMRIGQPVRIIADIYGRSEGYHGVVVGFSAGTGSSFSLLPPENATGNWIKVVQRVPVKIALAQEELAAAPLLIGLSCVATVDIRDASGPMLAAPSAQTDERALFVTGTLDHDPAPINEEIDRLINDNAGM